MSHTGNTNDKDNNRSLVFVYGTLKQGFPNHYLIERLLPTEDATYLGNYQTTQTFPLVIGPYSVPFLLNLPGSGHQVVGELYSVTDSGLVVLDELEGIAIGNYERLPIEVAECSGDGSGRVIQAEGYFGHKSFAGDMWRKLGEVGIREYTKSDAEKYVKAGDRVETKTLREYVRDFLSSSD